MTSGVTLDDVTRQLKTGEVVRVVAIEQLVLEERVRGRLPEGGWISLRGVGTKADQVWAKMTSCKPVSQSCN